MATDTAQRQSRFKRDLKKGLRTTERDLDILQLVGRRRFLDINHVADLLQAPRQRDGRSQVTERRLNRLFHHGYLDRPKTQLNRYVAGSKPTVYCLTPKGVLLVVQNRGVAYAAGSTERTYLEHALLTSDIHVSAELSCRRHGIYLTPFEEILERHASEATKRRVGKERVDGWPVTFTHTDRKEYTLPLYPDDIFVVPGKRDPSLLFVEADRGTEPLTRTDLRHRSSIYKTLVLYNETWKQWRDEIDTPEPPYGFRHPRVLFVVSDKNTARRVTAIQKLGQGSNMPPGLFLFARHDELLQGDFLTYEWQNLDGKPKRLLSKP